MRIVHPQVGTGPFKSNVTRPAPKPRYRWRPSATRLLGRASHQYHRYHGHQTPPGTAPVHPATGRGPTEMWVFLWASHIGAAAHPA
jgi:hypothetical protein